MHRLVCQTLRDQLRCLRGLCFRSVTRFARPRVPTALYCTVFTYSTGMYLHGCRFWKKRAEEELQRSGLDYTIIRPGGGMEGDGRGWIALPNPGQIQGLVILYRFGKQ